MKKFHEMTGPEKVKALGKATGVALEVTKAGAVLQGGGVAGDEDGGQFMVVSFRVLDPLVAEDFHHQQIKVSFHEPGVYRPVTVEAYEVSRWRWHFKVSPRTEGFDGLDADGVVAQMKVFAATMKKAERMVQKLHHLFQK